LGIRNFVRARIRDLGWDVVRYREHNDTFKRFIHVCGSRRCECVLDVGANTGQFATKLRKTGYRGTIVSFEPLSEAHAKLSTLAKRDSNWRVARRVAVGAVDRTTTINISKNSESSSVLPMLDRHVVAAPRSEYIDSEEVEMLRLDTFIESEMPGTVHPFALKIDAQGYEAEIIEGISRNIGRVQVIFLELSLVPLYQGAPLFLDMYERIESLGFRCVSITPGFTDPRTFEMLQVDGLFARSDSTRMQG